MYVSERAEQQKAQAKKVADVKRKRAFQGDHLNEHWAAGSTGEDKLLLPQVTRSPPKFAVAEE